MKQTLDNLFFDFIDLTKKLQPKVFIVENVKGILVGEANKYVQKIIKNFEEAGYEIEYWILDASKMGVPQRRERVFFIGIRKDLTNRINGPRQTLFSKMPCLNLCFNGKEISYGEIEEKEGNKNAYGIAKGILKYWKQIEYGRSCSDVHPKGHYFQELKLSPFKPLPTLRAGSNSYYHYEIERKLFTNEIVKGSSFPIDYNFMRLQPIYICGMSVPPIMMAQIATKIKEQWFDRLL